MVKYIMLFKVEGSLKYLSHLELMKLFRQCFKRGQLPVAFSEGFNPHMKLSFALAKGVGLESEGELLELEVESTLNMKKALKLVNNNLPKGIKVLEIEEKTETNKSLTALLEKAEYDIVFACMDENRNEIMNKIDSFLSHPSILITLKTKKGIRVKEVKEEIITYKLSKKKGIVDLKILTTCGSERTLRIEPLIKTLVQAIGFNGEYTIKRLALYGADKILIHCI
ncbi:hypothetical protein AZF37_05815 [endosymbiont 'TC1' of Trimyema compressum]|uniref:TIGR03936 family radical SAM-associated protein n=1 Tax=endosymbiont 'TC1' of Trimyema compressum TaxID=243899 RepID=UPI0007F111EC|nr:TIGR03936 family radical SAM-associated protein [endosymbiont 'TC1' of Trimyema compressum]AMP20756.1 hypothetical protein AZF37_05815 [endosymbiont 'TC1' of Trimyema compressum]